MEEADNKKKGVKTRNWELTLKSGCLIVILNFHFFVIKTVFYHITSDIIYLNAIKERIYLWKT